MGATGIATLDFGAFPGKSDASVAVTGQGSIVAGSLVEAWIRPDATADHTADEHMLETLKVFAANIVAATGFTIYGFNTSELNSELVPGGAGVIPSLVGTPEDGSDRIGGVGTRLWGTWTIAWAWN